MLGVFKKIFSSDKVNSFPLNEDESEFEPDLPENPNFVTERSKIVKLLNDLAADISLCTIEIEDCNDKFTSTILETNEEKGSFILDELTPFQGNRLIVSKDEFKLSTRLKGIYLSFISSRIKYGTSNGIDFYEVDLPTKIYYPQRRSTPRITFRSLQIFFQAISTRNQLTVSGQVFDISRGGIGIILSDNRARIQRGEKLTNCRMLLPGDFEVKFDMTVRSIKPQTQNSSIIQIGGYFENLSSRTEKKLEHFLTALEREDIRRRKA